MIKDLPFHRCWHWELRQTRWQIYPLLADLPPPLASSGQEWQFHISTVRAHIGRWSGRSTGRSTPLVLASSGQEWWFHTSTVRAHIGRWSGRSTGRSTPLVLASSGQEWWFHTSTVRVHIGRWSGRSTGRSTPQYWHLVVKNGNFTFLLLDLILADEVADLLAVYPPVLASSGQEWQFLIGLSFLIRNERALWSKSKTWNKLKFSDLPR